MAIHNYAQFEATLEDFWSRQEAKSRYRRDFYIFGQSVTLASNNEAVLEAIDASLSLFSQRPSTTQPPLRIQFVVQAARVSPGPAPDHLMQLITYTGDAAWLMWQLGGWGTVYVDLAAERATAVITPELATRPDLISQSILNTILLNFCIARGFGMLHASCLVQDDRILLLMAPHNSGKSTTALRLALSGYRLLSDSMIFIAPDDGSLVGFPVGKIKLRPDMLPHFPKLQPYLRAEAVRDETKFSLDLRLIDGALVCETAVFAHKVTLCLLQRSDGPHARIAPATPAEVSAAVRANSLYYDTADVWQRNLLQIEPLVSRATAYHLLIGSEAKEIITAVSHIDTC